LLDVHVICRVPFAIHALQGPAALPRRICPASWQHAPVSQVIPSNIPQVSVYEIQFAALHVISKADPVPLDGTTDRFPN